MSSWEWTFHVKRNPPLAEKLAYSKSSAENLALSGWYFKGGWYPTRLSKTHDTQLKCWVTNLDYSTSLKMNLEGGIGCDCTLNVLCSFSCCTPRVSRFKAWNWSSRQGTVAKTTAIPGRGRASPGCSCLQVIKELILLACIGVINFQCRETCEHWVAEDVGSFLPPALPPVEAGKWTRAYLINIPYKITQNHAKSICAIFATLSRG